MATVWTTLRNCKLYALILHSGENICESKIPINTRQNVVTLKQNMKELEHDGTLIPFEGVKVGGKAELLEPEHHTDQINFCHATKVYNFTFLIPVLASITHRIEQVVFAIVRAPLRFISLHQIVKGRRGGLMVSALDSGASGPGSSPGRGHCVVFLGKTLYSYSASLHPGV